MQTRKTLLATAFLILLWGCGGKPEATKNVLPTPAAVSPASERLSLVDANSDGKVEFEEWAASSVAKFHQYRKTDEELLTAASIFSALVRERDIAQGVMARRAENHTAPDTVQKRWAKTQHQLERGAMHSNDQLSERATQLVRLADTDMDGLVTREEWLAPVAEQFSIMDKDRDGTISEPELGQHLK